MIKSVVSYTPSPTEIIAWVGTVVLSLAPTVQSLAQNLNESLRITEDDLTEIWPWYTDEVQFRSSQEDSTTIDTINLYVLLPRPGIEWYVTRDKSNEDVDNISTLRTPNIPWEIEDSWIMIDGVKHDPLKINDTIIADWWFSWTMHVKLKGVDKPVEQPIRVCFARDNGDGTFTALCEQEDIVTSTEEVEQDEFPEVKVYPNPAGDYVTFEYPGGIDEIRVFTALGQRHWKYFVSKWWWSTTVHFDTSDFPSWTYYFYIVRGNDVMTKKVVIK